MANTSKDRTTICIKRSDYIRLQRMANGSHRKVSNQITYVLDTWERLITDEARIRTSGIEHLSLKAEAFPK